MLKNKVGSKYDVWYDSGFQTGVCEGSCGGLQLVMWRSTKQIQIMHNNCDMWKILSEYEFCGELSLASRGLWSEKVL